MLVWCVCCSSVCSVLFVEVVRFGKVVLVVLLFWKVFCIRFD